MDGTFAEVRLFAGTFAPNTWASCEGQLMSIAQNTALFSLLGTTYGGNGSQTFGLPDFRGRVAIGNGAGAGLTSYTLGQKLGVENFTLTPNNLPAHTHTITGSVTISGTAAAGNIDIAQGAYPATLAETNMYSTTSNGSFMTDMQHNLGTASIGASTAVSNIQPVLGLYFVICLSGTFPQRQ